LSKKDLHQIVDLMLSDVDTILGRKQITLTVSEHAKNWLIAQGYDKAMGARPLRRVIESQILDKVTDYYLDHPDTKHLQATLQNDTIAIAPVSKKAASSDTNKGESVTNK
jgi:ATP-dependent Clp protease ATP-binding subunit ClpL